MIVFEGFSNFVGPVSGPTVYPSGIPCISSSGVSTQTVGQAYILSKVPAYIPQSNVSAPITPQVYPDTPINIQKPKTNWIVQQAVYHDDNQNIPSGVLIKPLAYTAPILTNKQQLIQQQTLSAIKSSNGIFLNKQSVPIGSVVSKYMTIDDLTIHCTSTHDMLQQQSGLTIGEIADNLQYLSFNIIDTLCDNYGRGAINILSAFRLFNGSSSSLHNIGLAVDIGFNDISLDQVAVRAAEIAGTINFNTLQLTYTWNGSSYTSWIHLSILPNGNLSKVSTYGLSDGFKAQGIINRFLPTYPINNSNTSDGIITA